MKKNIKSWGNNPKINNQKFTLYDENFAFSESNYLPNGLGRSYGDVGLNENGILISSEKLDSVISFDDKNGILNCESGMSLEAILRLITPKGWFLPVVPGTRNVTLGGAIANDIHGKNHHKVGTIGNYVKSLKLLRSDGNILHCDDKTNKDYFLSTIAGLGLTGLIISVEIMLIKIESEFMDIKTFKYKSLDEYWEINEKCEQNYEYTVSWVDCLHNQKSGLRGIYIAGNHSKNITNKSPKKELKVTFPFTPPFSLVNNLSVRLINHLYYTKNKKTSESLQYFKNYFFPLDVIQDWNKAYGRNGFFQYQFVIPKKNAPATLDKVLATLKENKQVPALGVLKSFGNIKSPGLLSFPKEGVTLALDFPNKGKKTQILFDQLNEIIFKNDGRLYPAKDAFMKSDEFEKSYEKIKEFSNYIDPKFSSSFWRRVNT
jgi:FAD/FMN-containing dehydrogenase